MPNYTIYKNIAISCLGMVLCFFVFYIYFSPKRLINKELLINNIMNYQMPEVLKRCQKDFNYTDQDIIILEQEFKRFLILCIIKENVDKGIHMYSSDVDNLWHSFILFTKEYGEFCSTYAGQFIHHSPLVNDQFSLEQIKQSSDDFRLFLENYKQTFDEEAHSIWFLDQCIV